MTSSNSRKGTFLGIAALLFPLLVLAGVTGKAIMDQHAGEAVWQVRIAGYDPRDLLYGHYLTFRYDWDMGPNPEYWGDRDCLCLTAQGATNKDPLATPVRCESVPQIRCDSVIRTWNVNGTPWNLNRNTVAERYFIPEEHAAAIERLFRDGKHVFRMELMAHKDRSVAVRGLYIDDIKLHDYLKDLPQEERDGD